MVDSVGMALVTTIDAPVRPDIVRPTLPTDERRWVPLGENVWVHPLQFDISAGGWVNLLRARGTGVVSRHLHPTPVHGYVIKGSWRYLEHDWIAHEGDYIYEPPGEVHTLVVGDGCEEMITFFVTSGSLIYVDEQLQPVGFDTVHSRIELTRNHYRAVGLDPAEIDAIIR